MKITNKQSLPGALVAAMYMDPYDAGNADISVTSLIEPPRRRIMRQHYGDVVTMDVADRLWPLLGSAFHKLMEAGLEPEVVKEERLYAEHMGWRISGQIDRRDEGRSKVKIQDYKVTTVFSVRKEKVEWAAQLNLYGWLHYQNFKVWPDLEIVALCRDWREQESKRVSDYPKAAIVTIPIRRWSEDHVNYYLSERVRLHQEAQALYDQTGEIPDCTKEDRWETDAKWRVVGTRAASKKPYTHFMESTPDGLQEEVERLKASGWHDAALTYEPPTPRRCERYCEFADHCDQLKRLREEWSVKEIITDMGMI